MKKTSVDYDCLLSEEFDKRKAEAPIVYQPIGCMEWHGKHLPLGLDGLKAAMICRRTALKYGGIVLPSFHFGIHPPFLMEHFHKTHNLYISNELFERLMGEICDQLASVGFKVIVLLTGHFPAYQGKLLKEFALRHMWSEHGRAEIIVSDDDEAAAAVGRTCDHAGIWETSLMMELYPDLVKLDRLDDLMGISPQESDPRQGASREIGSRACEWWVDNLGRKIQASLEKKT